MGESLLYWMGILKHSLKGLSGGSAGRIVTYICPLIKGHPFGDDLFYRIIFPEELGKGLEAVMFILYMKNKKYPQL